MRRRDLLKTAALVPIIPFLKLENKQKRPLPSYSSQVVIGEQPEYQTTHQTKSGFVDEYLLYFPIVEINQVRITDVNGKELHPRLTAKRGRNTLLIYWREKPKPYDVTVDYEYDLEM